MSSDARLPLRTIVVSTVIALIAAVATYVVLNGGNGSEGSTAGRIELTPEGGAADGAVEATFTTFDGAEVALSSLQGSPLLVNFFASTCAPCVLEMPDLEQVHRELGDKVMFLGLALQDRPEDARDLVARTGVTYRTAQDKDASAITALGGTVLPTTVLLDSRGRVVASHSGQLDAAGLRRLIADKLGVSA